MLYRDDIDGIMHYSINVVTDMRSINRFSSIVCEKCYRYRLHRPLCKSCPPRYIVCAAIVNKQQNSSLRGIADEDIRWRDIKQIYHALFRATSEIMDSSVTEIALFSSGLRPSENSAFLPPRNP